MKTLFYSKACEFHVKYGNSSLAGMLES